MIENKLKKTNHIEKMVPSKNKVMNEDSSSNLTEPKKMQISDPFKNSIEENTLNQKQTSKFEEMNKCEICGLIFSVNEFMSIGECEHSYCHLCLRQYIFYKAGMFERRIKCPDQICEERLSQKSKVYSYLPEDVKKRIKKIQEYHQIVKSPNQRLCPNENCQGRLILKSGQKGQLLPTSKCETCSTTFCTKCFFKKHKGDCDNYHLDFFKNNLNYKRCAKCQRIIQKVEGCHHITCTCGYQFCYICGKEWSHDHLCENQFVMPRNCFSPCPECIQIVCKVFLANLLLLCSIIYYILLIPFTLIYFLFFLLVAAIGGPCFYLSNQHPSPQKILLGIFFLPLTWIYLLFLFFIYLISNSINFIKQLIVIPWRVFQDLTRS